MKCLQPILAVLRASVFILSGLEWAFLQYLLPCSAFYCTVVHCSVSFCTAVNCTAIVCNSFCDFYCCKLYRIVLQCLVSFCIAVNCTVLLLPCCIIIYCCRTYFIGIHRTVLLFTAKYHHALLQILVYSYLLYCKSIY